MKIALIGLGNIGKTIHLPHLLELPEVEVVGICRRNEAVLNKLAKHFRIEQAYTDHRKMFEEQKPDAVLVATRDHPHLVSDCLEAGVHVLVEKPFCEKLTDAESLVTMAREKGLVLMVAYMKRYDPGYELGAAEISKTQDITFIRVHNYHGQYREAGDEIYSLGMDPITPIASASWPKDILEAQLGKGANNDSLIAYRAMLGIFSHDINAMRGLFGEPRRVLKSEFWGNPAARFEYPYLVAIIEFNEKVRGVLEFAPTHKRRHWDEVIEAFAPQRLVTIRFLNPQLKNCPARVVVREGSDLAVKTEFEGSHQAGFKREILHFIDCVRNNKPPLTSGEDAKRDMEVISAIIRSYVENRPVDL